MSHQLPPPTPYSGGSPTYGTPSATGHGGYLSADAARGETAAQLSLAFGIIGLIFAGFVFSPLAIWQASKAEKLGRDAKVGKVLGWIGTVLWAIVIVLTLFGIAAAISAGRGY